MKKHLFSLLQFFNSFLSRQSVNDGGLVSPKPCLPAGRFSVGGFLLFFYSFFFLIPSPVSAQGPQAWGDQAAYCVYAGDVATIQGISCLLANVLSVAITMIGLAGFVMFIYGAIRYMVSGGDSKATEAVRNTYTNAIIGIVVALSAAIILSLIASFTGVSLFTRFVLDVEKLEEPAIQSQGQFGAQPVTPERQR